MNKILFFKTWKYGWKLGPHSPNFQPDHSNGTSATQSKEEGMARSLEIKKAIYLEQSKPWELDRIIFGVFVTLMKHIS